MIIVRTMQDVDNIPVKSVVPYVRSLIMNILNAYSSNGSIETVGAVYFLEDQDDVRNYQQPSNPHRLPPQNLKEYNKLQVNIQTK